MELFSPRMQRALMIGSTAVLPRALRIEARLRLFTGWHLRMARAADVVFVRHPKTGGTWLRALITRMYAQKYGLASDRVVRYDELQAQNAALPRFVTTSGYLSWERRLTEAIVTDPVLRKKRLLFMPRHPIDVATSWYNQFRKRTSAFKREMIQHDLADPFDRETIGRIGFMRHPEIGLPHVIRYHNTWFRLAEQHPRALILRYEDLRQDTVGSLKRLADFLGDEFDERILREAAEFGSVENMRGLEESGYFKNKSLRLRDGQDPETLKVRRARVGGYREDVGEAEAREFEAMMRRDLDPGLGYHALIPPE
ncbi:MAG: sulfotransferase domain-containing protein [Myxococcota bacterium]|nr:sulfotransferase domain-containing protein [Myxococcota bacterium]